MDSTRKATRYLARTTMMMKMETSTRMKKEASSSKVETKRASSVWTMKNTARKTGAMEMTMTKRKKAMATELAKETEREQIARAILKRGQSEHP
jgi:hypothetical protein